MTELRYRKLWLGIGFALVALVVFLSLTPEPVDAGQLGGVKIGHFVAYLVLMLWFAQLYRALPARIALVAAFVLMGVVLEYAQGMTGYRSFAYSDMGDNAQGVVLGFMVGSTRLGTTLARVEEWMAA
jgi:VanZ family protein